MERQNIVSWRTMISGCTWNGFTEQALALFDEMLQEGPEIKPNWVTICTPYLLQCMPNIGVSLKLNTVLI